MYIIQNSYIQLNQKEIDEVKGIGEIIDNFAARFQGAYEANGTKEDEAVDNCYIFSDRLLKAYYEFVDTLQTYGNFE